jgi:hypothetical protein
LLPPSSSIAIAVAIKPEAVEEVRGEDRKCLRRSNQRSRLLYFFKCNDP